MTRTAFRCRRWSEQSTAPHGHVERRPFRVTHAHHPLFGQEFDLVERGENWGEDRAWFHACKGQLRSLPSAWTDLVLADPFNAVAAGRAMWRTQEMLELVGLIKSIRP